MNKKLVKDFLITIVVIKLMCVLISTIFKNNICLIIMGIIVGFSPSISSYISQKRNYEVENFKEWLSKIFVIKNNKSTWVVIISVLIIFSIWVLLMDFYILIAIWIPIMQLLQCANEEAGWRMIIQPELEKSFNFHIATIITAVIEWLWYILISTFMMNGMIDINFLLLGIICLILSYVLATIKKATDSIFMCIITHSIINVLFMTFAYKINLFSCLVCLAVTILSSTLILKIGDINK